jgi:hypothetical protein
MLDKEDMHLLDDLIDLQKYNQLDPHRSKHSDFYLNSNLYEYIYSTEPLSKHKVKYLCEQFDGIPKDNQFGYYMITLRYLKKWKTEIKRST